MSLESEAKALRNNEAFKAALGHARDQAMNAALACDVRDDEGRRRYLDAVRTIDKVEAHIVALATTGEETPDIQNFYQEQSKSRFARLLGLQNP